MDSGKEAEKRGGRREGAGRPKKVKDPVKKMVTIEKAMVAEILKKDQSVSTFLREAGERRLEEGW